MSFEKYPQLKIFGNEMNFDQNDKLDAFTFPVVHSHSKHHVLSKNRIYRKNVLLLGDIVEVSYNIDV